MMLCNKTSRYHVAAAAIRGGAFHNPAVSIDAHEKASYVMHLAQKYKDYIYANGKGQIILIWIPWAAL
jgi:xylulose-5-phosphate/fructose-6-phosphate phosphoketolase